MWRERRPGTDGISTALVHTKGLATDDSVEPVETLASVPQGISMKLTAASAQSVRLVVAFTKGRGTLRYLEVSCGPSWLVSGS